MTTFRLSATILLACMAWCPAPASAQPKVPAADGDVSAAAPSAFRRAGIDLKDVAWYASANLPPTATPAEIRAAATQTTPTVTLRTDTGGTGMLFALVNLVDPPAGGAVVTLGDIDGADETFFNGRKIGETRGSGVTDHGIPRVYYVEQPAIRQGTNVLALRLSGTYGAGTFGIRREPLSFGFVPSPPLTSAALSPRPGRGVPAIAEKDARDAIREADPKNTATAPLLRKRPSFGRFGKLLNDGLPAVAEITPTRIAARRGPQFNVSLDAAQSVEIAADANDPGVDGWHKRIRVKGPCSRQPIEYTMLQHVMYPGGVLTLEQGTVLQLKVKFAGRKGLLLPLSEAEAQAVSPSLVNPNFSAFVFFEPSTDTVPAVVAVSDGAANATRTEGQIDITVSRGAASKTPAKIFVFFPTGLRRVTLPGKVSRFFDVAAATEPGETPVQTVRRWLRVGLHEPVAVDEYSQVRAEEDTVRVYQLTRHAAPRGLDVGSPIACLPPQLAFSRDVVKYPVRMPATTSTGVLTFSGPLFGAEVKSDRLAVVHYDLPLPPMGERGLIAMSAAGDLQKLLNESVTGLPQSPRGNGVDVFYKGRTQAFQAFSYLDAATRRRVTENTAAILPAALRESAWQKAVEPFSGIEYWWTYFIEGPFFGRFDQEWGNGLALYGLHTAVKYTGQWELVLQNWEAIDRMFSWFAATDDWEWMRASNGEHGHGTGAGDCASVSYVGPLSYAKLARNAGRTDDYCYGLYAASRAAVFLLNRFAYNPFATENGLKDDKSIVIGFHEGMGFLSGEMDGYPWNATSAISGNGVQPENFDLYLRHAPELLREYERTFEQAYPGWADGTHKYPRRTIYRDNSGYITLPHIYLRTRLGMDSADQLAALVRGAAPNRHLWWLAPPVLAEIIGLRLDAYVSDWGRCAFLGGEGRREADTKRRRVELRFENRIPPDVVEITISRRPFQVQINDGPVPLTDLKYADGKLTLRLRRPGTNTVVMYF